MLFRISPVRIKKSYLKHPVFLLCVLCLSGCLALCVSNWFKCMSYFSAHFSEMIIKFMNVNKQNPFSR